MNKRQLNIAMMREYRKRAFTISTIVHGVVIIVCAFLFFKAQQVQELEDEIQVELLSELVSQMPRQPIVKKKAIPKKEPVKPKQEMPVPKQETPTQKKMITSQKQVSDIHPKPSLEIAKMPAGAAAPVDIQNTTVTKRTDVDAPALDTPDLSTDAQLTPSPESVLSPIASDIGDSSTKGYGRREGIGVRSPGKSTGEGIRNIKETGAGKARKGRGSGAGGTADGTSGFGNVMGKIADEIVNTSGGNPIDVVFLLDTSGSMKDNIRGVATHLGQMTGVYNASDIDYALGLTQFNTIPEGSTKQDRNDIRVSQLTTDLVDYQRSLFGIRATIGDENALDALSETIQQLKFRPTTSRHIILVTDEGLTSAHGRTVDTIIAQCQKYEIYVTVIGHSLRRDLRKLATQTGGKLHEIPEDKPSAQ